MKKFKLLPLLLPFFLLACASNQAKETAVVVGQAASFTGTGRLNIAPVNFAKGMMVRQAVRDECQLPAKLARFIQNNAGEQYAVINLQAKESTKSDFLQIEIVDLPLHSKRVMLGRDRQWVGVKGWLIKNGKKTASFTASRTSMGGFMGAYKGTCAVLGRCTKALGHDIAIWLKNPVDGAYIGDI